MNKLKDMRGEKFGRLTVIERVANNGKHAMWKCKCDCGNEVIVTGTNLRKGFTKSCGCLTRLIDLTGEKFGRLTVIERAENDKRGQTRWKCKCDCGNEVIVIAANLIKGNSRSCGCLRDEQRRQVKDLTGEKFGRLTVIERAENKGRYIMWRCQCDCGNITLVEGSHLKDGHTQSCGCRNREIISKPFGEAAFNQIIYTYKIVAEKTGREFSLSEDEFRELILADCFYCGKKPSLQYHHGKRRVNGSLIYNGIDRIDNSKGYVQGNVRTCCRQCNIAKHHYTEEEFKRLITAIYKHLNLGEQM